MRFALVCYAAAGAVMLATTWPGPLAALVALPYLATVWPFRNVTDETAERATAGWRRFLWINQIAGFLVTLLLIWYWLLTADLARSRYASHPRSRVHPLQRSSGDLAHG